MKEIIVRAVNSGWMFKYLFNTDVMVDDFEVCSNLCVGYRNGAYEPKEVAPFSLSDLLSNESFVKALFGEEEQCMSICPINCDSESGDCITKIECKTLPVYIQHCRRLSTIFDQQKKIDYIKRNMR